MSGTLSSYIPDSQVHFPHESIRPKKGWLYYPTKEDGYYRASATLPAYSLPGDDHIP